MAGIALLPPEEARKIAAGEVIDRPSALIREFMDNALDAQASAIEVSVEGGGIVCAGVSDDGEGMGREDLELCCLTHATSKIRSLEDLEKAESLGFRGEALAAAAAVSRLEILSSRDGREAWKLEAGPGGKERPQAEPGRRNKGTTVRARGLFDTVPARRRFLKREGSEAVACRNAFNDKALTFPERSFRFFQDEKLKAFLPPDSSFKERFSRVLLREGEGRFLREITAPGPGFRATLVFGGPELFRPDRRLQYVFANRRRIQDYALIQALEFGLRGWFPNGTHPVGAVFVSIDPALADFNIHPAKREARFADPASLHHAVTQALENFRRRAFPGFASEDAPRPAPEPSLYADSETGSLASRALASPPDLLWEGKGLPEALFSAESPPNYIPKPGPPVSKGIRYLGRLFELFILAEDQDRLFIIDQHAAHERLLYNRFIQGPIPRQELLVAIPFFTENPEDNDFLKTRQENLAALGVVVEEDGDGWRITALPADWRLSDAETIREILGLKNAGKNMPERWAAALSCKGAVKDGDYLDEDAALALAKAALALPDPRCPHGRPLWQEIRREDLFKAVRRL